MQEFREARPSRPTFSLRGMMYFVVIPAYTVGATQIATNRDLEVPVKLLFTLGPTVLLAMVLIGRRQLKKWRGRTDSPLFPS